MKKAGATKESSSGKYGVPVVKSTFAILEELSNSGAMRLNEVTQQTGVSKSTVFRVLTTLQHLGYVVRDSERQYHVSPNLAALVSEGASSDLLRGTALSHMFRLRDECGETVNLGRLQLDKVEYIVVVPSEFALRLSERPGAIVAVHASALGKALLAFSPPAVVEALIRGRDLPRLTRNTITDPEALMNELQRVRERGFALDKGEVSVLATCVAAPILGVQGTALAAMSLSGPASRFNPRRDSPIVESLLKAASQISKQLRSTADGAPAAAKNGARNRHSEARKAARCE
jgi:IclR family transcriptional regulator, acetate operon repressor